MKSIAILFTLICLLWVTSGEAYEENFGCEIFDCTCESTLLGITIEEYIPEIAAICMNHGLDEFIEGGEYHFYVINKDFGGCRLIVRGMYSFDAVEFDGKYCGVSFNCTCLSNCKDEPIDEL